jgi:polysaccharide chain length determinant protein (PEP-CTERM system associated)
MPNNSLSFIDKLSEYRSVFVYRWPFILVASVVLFAAFLTGVHFIPDTYEASTTILAHPRKVPEKYVATTIPEDSSDRLNLLQQEILSSTRLLEVIQKFGLYHKVIQKRGRDAAVTLMQKHIKIQTSHGSSSGPSAFTLVFSGEDPKTLAPVANELANSFILKNLSNREQQVQGTADFISDALKHARTDLDTQEAQLREFRMAHLGEMPEQMNANLQAIGHLQAQYESLSDKMAQLDEEEVLIEDSPESVPALRSGSSSSPAATLRLDLSQEQAHLTDLLTHATPVHPDVVASKNKIEELKEQLKTLPSTISGEGVDRPVQARLQVIQKEREHLAEEQAAIKTRLNSYQDKVDAIPLRQEQLSGLTRDYESARDHYRSLLEKSYSAQMASELESKQDAERFEVLDPAQAPEQPAAPNRPLLWGVSALVALAGGFVLAYGREHIDNTVKTETDLIKILPVEIELVGSISNIAPAGVLFNRRVFQSR